MDLFKSEKGEPETLKFEKCIIDISPESGFDPVGVIAHLNNFAVVCIQDGKLKEGEDLLQKLITEQTSILLPKNSVTILMSEHELVNKKNNDLILSLKGDVTDCKRENYDEGMSNITKLIWMESTMDHTQKMATILYNFGQLKIRQEKNKIAEKYFSVAFKMLSSITMGCMMKFKKQDYQIQKIKLLILHGLGQVQYRIGRYEEALKSYSKALEIGREYLDSYHLKVAEILNCMGVVKFHIGCRRNPHHDDVSKTSNNGAILLCTEALNIQKAALGYFHKDVATTLNNIGRIHYSEGDYKSAIEVYNMALQIRSSLMGNNHLDVAATTYNLGQTYHQLGNFSAALIFYENFLGIAHFQLGKNHHDVAITMKYMAQIHHEECRFESALKLYEQALTIFHALVRNITNEIEIASILNKIGNLHFEKNDLERALKTYEEGLKIERQIYSNRGNPNLLVTLTNIGQIYRNQGKYEVALKYFTEAHEIQKLTACDHKLSDTLKNIALILYQMGKYEQSLNAYQEILYLKKDAHGDIHVEVANTLNSIGMVLFKQGLKGPAMESLFECLQIRQKLLGKDHVDVAASLFNVATLLYEHGDEDEAIFYYKETLRVERATLGCEHEDLVVTLQSLGQIHYQRGELDQALKYFNETLRVERSNIQNNQQQLKLASADKVMKITRILNCIGSLHLQRGDTKMAMEAYSEELRLYRQEGYDDDELSISGLQFYMLSKLHPECSAAA